MAFGKKTSFKRPKAYWHPRMILRRLLNNWPFYIWLASIAVVLMLFDETSTITSFSGAVETVEEPVAPLETARLRSIDVRVGERVDAGDIVGTMNTSLLDARIAIEQAEIAEAAGTLQDYEQRLLEFVRDFETSVQDASFELANQEWNFKRDAAELNSLSKIFEDLKSLREENLIGEQEMVDIRPRIAALQQTVDAYPEIIAIHSNRMQTAIGDREEMRRMLLRGEEGLGNERDIDAQVMKAIVTRSDATRAIFATIRERRELQRENYTLRATRGGVVSRVYHQPGDVVQAGEAVVRIVEDHPTRVIGFLQEIYLEEIKLGDEMRIWQLTKEDLSYNAVVQSIAPDVQALPGRLSPIRGQTIRGRHVILEIQGDHELVPGQSVRITRGRESLKDFADRLFQ